MTPRRNSGRTWDWWGWGGGAVLVAATLAAYSRTYSVPLLFDDIGTIANNASIRHWRSAWSPPYSTTAGGRPILNLSLALNYALSGMALWSYHLVNLAIHILAGLTLWGIGRRTLAAWSGAPAGPIAFSVALLWTLHPLQTESVTYIIQRAESLMGLFYLLTLYCFIRQAAAGATRPRVASGWAGGAVLFCLLGMATKEVMVSAPLIVLFYDRTFLAGTLREAWRRHRGVYLGLAASWLLLPFLVLSTHGRGGTSGFGIGVSWWGYALTQFPAVCHYLRLSFSPHPRVIDKGTEWVANGRAVWPSGLVVIALLAATGWALVRPGLNSRALGFAGLWFFAILAPSSLVPGNRQTAAEHRMYLALIPVILVTVVGVYRWLGRRALPLGLVLAGALFGLTWRRNQDYRSALALWSATVANCPANAFAHNNLGCELENLPGRTEESVAELELALRLKPHNPEAHNNLGNALLKLPGRLPEAIAHYQEAIRENPGLAEAHSDLGNALLELPGRRADAIAHYEEALRLDPASAQMHNNLGFALEKTPGRLADAIAQYEQAIQLDPAYAEAHNNLGNAFSAGGGKEQAIAQYREALRLQPHNALAHHNLGNALNALGRRPEAIAQYQEALRWDPALVEAQVSLGDALKAEGRRAEAIAHYEEALRLKPGMAEAHVNLGTMLNAEGRTAAAMAEYETALRLQPDDAEAHYNLANALNVAGRTEEAITQYEAALRLKPDDAEAHNNLGYALEKTPGRLAEAIAQYQEAVRLRPDYAAARNSLGYALAKLPGHGAEAIADFAEAVRLDPNYTEAYFNWGNALGAEGRTEEAIAAYQKALRLMPDNPDIRFNLALALLKTPGRTAEAVSQLEEILRLQPQNSEAAQLLARLRASPP